VRVAEDLEGVDEQRHVLARLERPDEEQVAGGEPVAARTARSVAGSPATLNDGSTP